MELVKRRRPPFIPPVHVVAVTHRTIRGRAAEEAVPLAQIANVIAVDVTSSLVVGDIDNSSGQIHQRNICLCEHNALRFM